MMELFIIGTESRVPESIVDEYISLIWTVRYNELGDFELRVPSTRANRTRFFPDLFLTLGTTKSLMMVEEVTDDTDEDGSRVLIIRGRTLDLFLGEKLARNVNNTGLTTDKVWSITGAPNVVAGKVVEDVCVDGVPYTEDILPDWYVTETGYGGGQRLPYPIDPITVDIKQPKSVLDVVREICQEHSMGFRVRKNDYDDYSIGFEIYMGRDRTTNQETNAAVVFSDSLDNLKNMRYIKSSAGEKTVCIATSKQYNMSRHHRIAHRDTHLPDGYHRRYIYVEIGDLPDDLLTDDVDRILRAAARTELLKYGYMEIFEGEISATSSYEFGKDYDLGDIVELQDPDTGDTTQMMVVENIFTSDSEGFSSHPTLRVHQFVQSGSWLGWSQNQKWGELTDEEWGTMP